ncbi:hypothetical protein [Kitasatospora cineracea]|uniref:Uncharacterized protein n=1 Tax=Kitasatospora cineracea TaxID=88074 RepID=A0A8G1UBD2_9ACTN|nr:hypothetical protein [Kitasatospora cineracea]ROR37633.1 hypothetical protein EDD39_5783 [Kitasatospora cineracea]
MGEPAADQQPPSPSSPSSSSPVDVPVCEVSADPERSLRGLRPGGPGERAACVLCGEPTEYPADAPGSPLCPVCTWQQAQRAACSG